MIMEVKAHTLNFFCICTPTVTFFLLSITDSCVLLCDTGHCLSKIQRYSRFFQKLNYYSIQSLLKFNIFNTFPSYRVFNRVLFIKNSIITRFTISNISSCRTFTFQQDYPFFSHFINNSSRLLLCKPAHLLNFCGSNLIVALQIF